MAKAALPSAVVHSIRAVVMKTYRYGRTSYFKLLSLRINSAFTSCYRLRLLASVFDCLIVKQFN